MTHKEVYVLSVTHRHGRDVAGVFENEKEIETALFQYIRDQWDEEVSKRGLDVHVYDITKYDEEEAIRLYFAHIVDDEYYEVQSAPYFPAETKVA